MVNSDSDQRRESNSRVCCKIVAVVILLLLLSSQVSPTFDIPVVNACDVYFSDGDLIPQPAEILSHVCEVGLSRLQFVSQERVGFVKWVG